MAKKRGNGEGSIYRRKNGGWVGQYTIPTPGGTKRKAVYGKTRKEVAARLANAISERENGLTFDAGKITIGEYLDSWLADSVRGSVRISTYLRHETAVRNHLKPALGKVRVSALTPAHVQRLYREKLEAGQSPRSVLHMHATLRRALNQAVKWGLIPRNVCHGVDAPRPPKTTMQTLSPIEARALLTAARESRFEAVFVLALSTGMRQGELLGLHWPDVDLKAGRLRVRRALIPVGDKPHFGEPKSAKARRGISLTAGAVEALRQHRNKQIAAGGYDPAGLVFCTSKGTPLMPYNLTARYFKPLLVKAGLPDIRFHDLRHTCATLLLGKAVHPKIVQEMLGHASIQLTLDTYSHVLPTMQARAVEAMADVLSEEKEPVEVNPRLGI